MHLVWSLLNQVFVYCDSTQAGIADCDSPCRNRKVKITRIVDESSECKKCMPVFQQVEFIIRRSSCEDVQITKENFNDLTKVINQILTKSNDKLGTDLAESKAQFLRFAIRNIRAILKEFTSEVEKTIVLSVADYNDASSAAVESALSLYSVAVSSLATLSETDISSALASPTSVFNTTVSSIISGVAVANNSALKSTVANLMANINDLIDRFRRELIEIIKQEIEDRVNRLIGLIKNNNENEIRQVEAAILVARDNLITDLEKHDLRLFEVIKYLLEICREELTGEKRTDNALPPFPLLFQGLGLNVNEGEFPLLYPGIGLNGILN